MSLIKLGTFKDSLTESFSESSMLSNDYDDKGKCQALKLQNAIEQVYDTIREDEHKPMILDIENGTVVQNSSLTRMPK